MSIPTFHSAKDTTPGIEVLQLKDFIARGEPAHWCVYPDYGGDAYVTNDYGDACAKLDSLGTNGGALVLWTRIGTSVTFRRREVVNQVSPINEELDRS